MEKPAEHNYSNKSAIGVLLVNLGTPEDNTPQAVRKYLAEFLWDPRVVELPRCLWWLILHCFILPFRPRRSARAYKKIWTQKGSPLLCILQEQAASLQHRLSRIAPNQYQVAIAMRYGKPSIAAGLEILQKQQIRRLLLLPMYPQYSATTTASAFDSSTQILSTWRWVPALRFINHYHDKAAYIDALAESILQHWETHGKPDRLLFSFHGIPQQYFIAGDPYHCECQKTARLVAERLNMAESSWQTSFQSRFGPKPWLQPYTEQVLKDFPAAGIRHVQIICPGFAADCLETLEEINIRARAIFMQAGGSKFSYIPALNDNNAHINLLCELVTDNCHGWVP